MSSPIVSIPEHITEHTPSADATETDEKSSKILEDGVDDTISSPTSKWSSPDPNTTVSPVAAAPASAASASSSATAITNNIFPNTAITAVAAANNPPSAVEFEPPVACVRRILKKTLPSSSNVGKDAVAAFSRASGIFIIYLTACANDFARENRRQTITANDVLAAIKELEFDEFSPELNTFLEGYREAEKSKKDVKAKAAAARAKEVKEENKSINADTNAVTTTTTTSIAPDDVVAIPSDEISAIETKSSNCKGDDDDDDTNDDGIDVDNADDGDVSMDLGGGKEDDGCDENKEGEDKDDDTTNRGEGDMVDDDTPEDMGE